ncbi:Phospholipase B [Varanus komodoensis]|uniref:Phospholipase B-like n=1 Tax=Varanus komodoensis TaxID=61221 RepID=A0A8D2Q0J0_VARKO|nr:phospholipase B-like 1 [Varanus komodoensis]KAF7248903.1 Phospholipase B [Varanus komodoensis]
MGRFGGGASFARSSSNGCCWWAGLCGLSLLWIAAETRADIHYATVYWSKAAKSFQIKDVLDKNGDAYGYYNDSVYSTGWGILEIKAGYGGQTIKNEDLMYAAGFLEGYLTASRMCDHLTNLYPQLIKNYVIERKVKNFMRKQDQWTRQQIKNNKDDPFWRHAGYIIAQLDGLYMGTLEWAKQQKRTPFSAFQVSFLNAIGDLLDLIPAIDSAKTDSSVMPGGSGGYQWDMGHCSALIKVLPGYENIYFAHSSWFTYAATLRIYKHWDFRIDDPQTSTGRASFSSYPGFLESLDDFYILGSGLILLQTTNSVYNRSLLRQVVPESLFAWQRVRIANMMADSGKVWAQIFEKQNSGTYNNQYMVLDTNKVKLQRSLDEGTLYVIEQIPKLVEYSDQTNILRKGYWPSYNIPFHENIYNLSGYAEYVKKYGLDFSYEMAPRAKIFRRDQGNVTDIESMKYIMRYNNYKKDPYARHNPCNTICCRADLNPKTPVPAGCYDSKIADINMSAKFTAYAISGPPVEEDLPVFSWNHFNRTKHQGLPDSYNFEFITMKPML